MNVLILSNNFYGNCIILTRVTTRLSKIASLTAVLSHRKNCKLYRFPYICIIYKYILLWVRETEICYSFVNLLTKTLIVMTSTVIGIYNISTPKPLYFQFKQLKK